MTPGPQWALVFSRRPDIGSCIGKQSRKYYTPECVTISDAILRRIGAVCAVAHGWKFLREKSKLRSTVGRDAQGGPTVSSSKLNGSVQRLAEAFGDVISDAMNQARADMRSDIRAEVQAAEKRLNGKIDQVGGAVVDLEQRLDAKMDRIVEDIVAEKQSERVS